MVWLDYSKIRNSDPIPLNSPFVPKFQIVIILDHQRDDDGSKNVVLKGRRSCVWWWCAVVCATLVGIKYLVGLPIFGQKLMEREKRGHQLSIYQCIIFSIRVKPSFNITYFPLKDICTTWIDCQMSKTYFVRDAIWINTPNYWSE